MKNEILHQIEASQNDETDKEIRMTIRVRAKLHKKFMKVCTAEYKKDASKVVRAFMELICGEGKRP